MELLFDNATETIPLINSKLDIYIKKYIQKPEFANVEAKIKIANILKIQPYKIIFLNSKFEAISLIINMLKTKYNITFIDNLNPTIQQIAIFLKSKIYTLQTIEQVHNTAVILSYTHYLTGELINLKSLSKKLKKNDNLIIADLSLCLGKIQMNFTKLGIDIAFFSSELLHAPKGLTIMIDFNDILQVSDYQFLENKNYFLSSSLSYSMEQIFNKKYYVKLKQIRDFCLKNVQNPKITFINLPSKKYNPFILAFKAKNTPFLSLKLKHLGLHHHYEPQKQIFRLSFSLFHTYEELKKCAEILNSI